MRPLSTSASMRAPAGPGGVKDDRLDVVAEQFDDLRDRRRRHPEHREPDGRLAAHWLRPVVRHADNRARRLVEHAAADPVEPSDIGDRRHHHDVGDADEGRRIARRQRRDHQLWHADRQLPHPGRDDRGAAAAADADDPPNSRAPGSRQIAAKAALIAATAEPRSVMLPRSRPSRWTDLVCSDIRNDRGLHEYRHRRSAAQPPSARMRSARNVNSSPLVSAVPTTQIGFKPPPLRTRRRVSRSRQALLDSHSLHGPHRHCKAF